MKVYGRHLRWTLCLAVLLLAAVAPAASAVVAHNHRGHFFGVTPHRNVQPTALLKSIQGTTTSTTSTRGTINYHGGPVLHTSAPYLIFWTPNGETIPASWESLLQRFFTDVAADSGKVTNVFAVARQFSDTSGYAAAGQTFSSNQVVVDTQPYPGRDAVDCPHVDSSSYPTCLTDAQVQQEVERLISADGLPTDGPSTTTLPANAPLYFVVLPSDVNECLQDTTGDCADNSFCAYHSKVTDGGNTVLYATIPTLPLAAGQDPKTCQGDNTSVRQEPNANPADVVLGYLSHEDNEAITDPLLDAWFSTTSGNEAADNCNQYGSFSPATGSNPNAFLPTLGGDASAGTLYDQVINRDYYYLQSLWSNGDANCEMRPTSGSTTAHISAPSGTYLAGKALTFSDSSSSGSITSATWDWGDGTASTGTGGSSLQTTESHTYATGGTYRVTLTLIDNRGNAVTATQTITVYPTAAFTYSAHGSTATFDASGSADPGGAIAGYNWSFGDGTTGSGAQTTHSYANSGSYTVTLTVTDASGRTSTTSQQVGISMGPLVSIASNPAGATVGQAVSFTGSASDPTASITNYSWNFGDGHTSSGSTDTAPSNTYADTGSYAVTLSVSDSNGFTTTVTTQLTVGPVAAFTVAPTQAADGESVTFDGTSSSDPEPGRSITDYGWTFSDGGSATGPAVTRSFPHPGTYTATLEVTNDAGETEAFTRALTVTDTAPAAAFNLSTASPTQNEPVQFDGSPSAPSDPTASLSYSWSFGDGTTATGPTATHSFTSAGARTVRLTVTDSYGASTTVSHDVTVQAPSIPTFKPPTDQPPAAVITVGTARPASGRPVAFSGSGSRDPDGSIVSYRWSFGDGATATSSAPSHTYARAGTYSVSLTVTDNAGQSTIAVRSLAVAAAGRITKVAIKPARAGATVAVSVSSAGTLTAGKRVFHLKRAGTVKLVIALTRAQLRTVQVKHLLKVRVPLRFAPALGPLASTSAVIAFRPAATSGHVAAAKSH